jgi:predicted MarR family transcription regulator
MIHAVGCKIVTTKVSKKGVPIEASGELDKRWHMAQTSHEVNLTELEYALMRTMEAFGRWQTECAAASSGIGLSGPENALLHIIRMNERPKSLKDIARLTNRDDIPNLQYALRKLVSLTLVDRTGEGRLGTVYSVTQQGRDITDAYARLRKALLLGYTQGVPDMESRMLMTAQTLDLLSGMYEQSARVAATHRAPH